MKKTSLCLFILALLCLFPSCSSSPAESLVSSMQLTDETASTPSNTTDGQRDEPSLPASSSETEPSFDDASDYSSIIGYWTAQYAFQDDDDVTPLPSSAYLEILESGTFILWLDDETNFVGTWEPLASSDVTTSNLGPSYLLKTDDAVLILVDTTEKMDCLCLYIGSQEEDSIMFTFEK